MNSRGLFYKIAFFLLLSSFAQAEVVERILAIVNSEIISLSDLKSYRQKLKKQELTDDLVQQLADINLIMKDDKALIDYLINERIIDFEVKKNNLSVTIEKVEQEIRSITSREKLSRSQLKDALAGRGVDFADYQNFIKSSLERHALFDREILSKIKISDEEMTDYYLRNTSHKRAQIYEYKIAHIFFASSKGGAAAAKDRGTNVLKKIRDNSASFEKIATQYSEDPEFVAGGVFGDFKAGEMSKEMESAVGALAAGETSDLVATKDGFHIFKVLKKSFVANPDFEARKPQISQVLMMSTFKKNLQIWLRDKRQQSFIKMNI